MTRREAADKGQGRGRQTKGERRAPKARDLSKAIPAAVFLFSFLFRLSYRRGPRWLNGKTGTLGTAQSTGPGAVLQQPRCRSTVSLSQAPLLQHHCSSTTVPAPLFQHHCSVFQHHCSSHRTMLGLSRRHKIVDMWTRRGRDIPETDNSGTSRGHPTRSRALRLEQIASRGLEGPWRATKRCGAR